MNLEFSKRELKELIFSWIILSLAISIVFLWNGSLSLYELFSFQMFLSLIVSLPIVGAAFISHEVGHKFVAQKFGYDAEYWMNKKMLLLSLFIAYAGGFILAAPGAVRIFGRNLSTEENGKISITGPLINLSFGSFLFLPLSFLPSYLGIIGSYGVLINYFLATFNLIPFGRFDGKKILKWNKMAYLSIFGFSLIITTYSYLYLI